MARRRTEFTPEAEMVISVAAASGWTSEATIEVLRVKGVMTSRATVARRLRELRSGSGVRRSLVALTSRLDALEREAQAIRAAILDVGGWQSAEAAWDEVAYLARTEGRDAAE